MFCPSVSELAFAGPEQVVRVEIEGFGEFAASPAACADVEGTEVEDVVRRWSEFFAAMSKRERRVWKRATVQAATARRHSRGLRFDRRRVRTDQLEAVVERIADVVMGVVEGSVRKSFQREIVG